MSSINIMRSLSMRFSRKKLFSPNKLSYHYLHGSSRRLNHSKWSYCMGPTSEPLLGITMGQVSQRAADKFGDEEAIISYQQNITKTYSQIDDEAKKLAAGLMAVGFKPGDRIGIWGPNNYEWFLTFFAAAKAGLILVNINPSYRASELKYCLDKVKVTGIICADQFKTSNFYEILRSIAPELESSAASDLRCQELPKLKIVISMSDKKLKGSHNFKELLNAANSEHFKQIEELETKIQFDDPFNIQFTSGTTGDPKAALLSHHNVANNGYFNGKILGYDKKTARASVCVPLFHCFGLVVGVVANSFFGCTTVLPCAGFDPVATTKCIKDHRVTSCLGTPTMFVDILNEVTTKSLVFDGLHAGVMGGAPCPEELIVALMNKINMKDITVMYGMTETSPVSFGTSPDDPISVRSSTIGSPAPHTEVKIVDEEGKVVPRGTSGELLIRGYSVFLGYWGDEKKTKETMTSDRWLKTGDIATMTENGHTMISGRIKDLIIRGGENIYPAEVENFFMGHPDVIEAQAVGVPCSRMGEEVAMWVRLEPQSKMSSETLQEWAKEKIAHYKIPRYILFKETFPRTISGKAQKFKMREITIKELSL